MSVIEIFYERSNSYIYSNLAYIKISKSYSSFIPLFEKFYLLNSDSLNLDEVFKPDDINDSDNFSISQLNIQLRYRWQIAPLSDFYIVATKTGSSRSMLTSFNELYEDIMDNPMSDQIIMKLRYRFGS